jgi:hypothetical protein
MALALDSGYQCADVPGVESDGASEVDGRELASLDESLHRSRVDVQERRGLVGRQERRRRSYPSVEGANHRCLVGPATGVWRRRRRASFARVLGVVRLVALPVGERQLPVVELALAASVSRRDVHPSDREAS